MQRTPKHVRGAMYIDLLNVSAGKGSINQRGPHYKGDTHTRLPQSQNLWHHRLSTISLIKWLKSGYSIGDIDEILNDTDDCWSDIRLDQTDIGNADLGRFT